jgi:hypothetical protein
MDYCSFSEFPTIRVLSHEMQANNTHIQINPNTHWKELMAAFETSKLPLINHQNQPLNRIFASPSTLRSEFSCTSIDFSWRQRSNHKSRTTSTPPFFENQNHTTYLLCCSSFRCSTARFLPSTPHLATPLPHNHHVSSSKTHIQDRKKRHKDFNTIKHHHISI